jgi:hypothetical protein
MRWNRSGPPYRRRGMKTLTAIAALTLTLTVAACGEEKSPAATPPQTTTPPGTALTVTFDADGKGTGAVKTWTLTCDPAGGDHPDAASACASLASAKDPFAPLAADAVCTDIFGGPSVATIKGTWRGQPVDARYSRENGCNISRWDALATVIPEKPASA